MTHELLQSSGGKEVRTRPQRHVVFAMATIPVEQMVQQLHEHSIDQISFVEMVLPQCLEDDNDQSMRLYPFGGVCQDKDTTQLASMRFLSEQSRLVRESKYRIYTSSDTDSNATYSVIPVRPESISLHVPGHEATIDGKKVNRFVSVSQDEFIKLLGGETVTVSHYEGKAQLAKHITADIPVNEREAIINHIQAYEQQFRELLLTQVNAIRRFHHQEYVTTLHEASVGEISSAYVATQFVYSLDDRETRDDDMGNAVPPVAALPAFVLYMNELSSEYRTEGMVLPPTRMTRKLRNALKYALRGAMDTLSTCMGEPLVKDSEANTTNIRGALVGVDTKKALAAMWPNILHLPLAKRTELLEIVVNTRFISELSYYLHRKPEEIEHAFIVAHNISSWYLANELRSQFDLFQEANTLNEITNAVPFTLCLYMMGYHPNNVLDGESTRFQKLLSGQAMMVFSHVLATLETTKTQTNALVQGALDTFLHTPEPENMVVDRTRSIQVMHRTVRMPINGKPLHLIVDERPKKLDERRTIKSYQERQPFDDFSINLVIADDNFKEYEQDIVYRMQFTEALRDAYLSHLTQELEGSGWKVSLVPGLHKTTSLESANAYVEMNAEEQKEFIGTLMGGKRAGSLGNLIVREKFIIQIERGNEVRYCEFCIYPFERINQRNNPLHGSGFMGFVEKLRDDMEGRYKVNRLKDVDPKDPLKPSALDQIKPPTWYAPLTTFFNDSKTQ